MKLQIPITDEQEKVIRELAGENELTKFVHALIQREATQRGLIYTPPKARGWTKDKKRTVK